MQQETIAAIDREVADLERQKAEVEQQKVELEQKKADIDSAIESLREAKDRLTVLSGGGLEAQPTSTAHVVTKSQEGNFEKIATFLNSINNTPQTIPAIAEGTGLLRLSVGRVLYRTRKEMFERKKVPGTGMVWSLKTLGGKTHSNLQSDDVQQKLKPKEAVIALIRRNPGKFRPGEVAGMLVGSIETESRNEKNLLFSTVDYLKKTGVIEQRPDRTLVLVKKE